MQNQTVGHLNEKNINFDMLKFEAESDQEIYDILLKQAKEISLTSSNMENNNIRVVDEAEIPRLPIKPNVFNNIILAIMTGLGIGIGLAFFLEYMDINNIKTVGGIMQCLELPVIGVLPYEKSLKGNKQLALPGNKQLALPLEKDNRY